MIVDMMITPVVVTETNNTGPRNLLAALIFDHKMDHKGLVFLIRDQMREKDGRNEEVGILVRVEMAEATEVAMSSLERLSEPSSTLTGRLLLSSWKE